MAVLSIKDYKLKYPDFAEVLKRRVIRLKDLDKVKEQELRKKIIKSLCKQADKLGW